MPAPKSPRKKKIRQWVHPNPYDGARLKELLKNPEWVASRPKGGRPPGVPDGMTKKTAAPLWEAARQKAGMIMAELEDKGIVEFSASIPEDQMAKTALKEAFVMAMSPLSQAAIKMTAIRTILEWTKAKPASKTDLTLASAEAWLKAVVEDHEKSE